MKQLNEHLLSVIILRLFLTSNIYIFVYICAAASTSFDCHIVCCWYCGRNYIHSQFPTIPSIIVLLAAISITTYACQANKLVKILSMSLSAANRWCSKPQTHNWLSHPRTLSLSAAKGKINILLVSLGSKQTTTTTRVRATLIPIWQTMRFRVV
jgi:hypothetical protein